MLDPRARCAVGIIVAGADGEAIVASAADCPLALEHCHGIACIDVYAERSALMRVAAVVFRHGTFAGLVVVLVPMYIAPLLVWYIVPVHNQFDIKAVGTVKAAGLHVKIIPAFVHNQRLLAVEVAFKLRIFRAGHINIDSVSHYCFFAGSLVPNGDFHHISARRLQLAGSTIDRRQWEACRIKDYGWVKIRPI